MSGDSRMTDPPEFKVCRKCGTETHRDNLVQYFRKKDQRKIWEPECKPCRRNYRHESGWYERENEKRRTDPAYRQKLREANYLSNYNITWQDKLDMLAAQGGVCAICGTDDPGAGKDWHTDHDHACCPEKAKSCGKCIRGILCNGCNSVLGWGGDDPDVLLSAAMYLLKFQDVVGVQRMQPAA